MGSSQTILELTAFVLAWWFGLYLLGRDWANPQMRFAGLGLATYALAIAAGLLSQFAPTPELVAGLARWSWPLLLLPAMFWIGCLVYLLPEDIEIRFPLERFVRIGLVPLALLLYFFAAITDLVVQATGDGLQPGPAYALLAAGLGLFLLVAILLLAKSSRQKNLVWPRTLILIATIFFGLGIGLLLFPFSLFPRWLVILAVGLDLIFLGLAVGGMDAFNQGETFRPDFFRSLVFSFFLVLIFAGQVALVMVLATGITFPMLALLLAVVITAVAIQTLADLIQSSLDLLVFARFPRIRQTRADSRVIVSAVSRSREELDPTTLDDIRLGRLTRRALSQMGNLPSLAASPLIRLGLIEARLAEKNLGDNSLERAAELKSLLSESINRLKPRSQEAFGTTDEWRYYNALYFPYVAGLKPYSRRADFPDLDDVSQQALDWFRTQVPERTLYNWQNAAAKLVAQDLREQSIAGR